MKVKALPLPDACADFVSMGYALRHVGDLSAAFSEFRRVLRPGGIACVLEITYPENRSHALLLKAYMRGVIPALSWLIARHGDTPKLMRYYWDTIETCVPPAQVMATLAHAGLEDAQLLDLGGRLAQRLLDEAGDGSTVTITQTELARRIGASREKVNRKLHEWEDEGWVTIGRSGIKLTQRKELHALIARERAD